MTNNEMVAHDAILPATTDVQERVDTMLANRSHIIEKVKPLLMEGVDIYTLPNMKKPSLGKPGAEKLAAIFGLTADFAVDKDTMEVIGEKANGKQYIAYVCNLSRHGAPVGQGRGATFIEWMRNNYEIVFNQPAGTSEEKGWKGPLTGTSKAGKPYTFWKVPSEPVFDPLALNKAIKMAQKSAFVDAVIRATGMSDLFTQDVEDMGTEPTTDNTPANATEDAKNEPVSDEPFPGTPNYQKASQATPSAPQRAVDDLGKADFPCPQCGSQMKLRNSARGSFYGCSNYPNCKHTQNV